MNSTTIARKPWRRPHGPRQSGRPLFGHLINNGARTCAASLPEPAHDGPDTIDFDSLDLDQQIRLGVADRGFTRTTPIQTAAFPIVHRGDDLIACAQTGTGKTAAFLLPIMQRLLAAPSRSLHDPPARTRVLVLAPTRELAVQIEDDFQGFAYHTSLSGVAVYGGVGADAQARALRAGTDIVVATPGRLLDHLNTGAATFEALEVLVLDEADRMLDMGFWPDVRRIVSALPRERQTLLFSATISDDVRRLAAQILRDPKVVRIGRAGGPPSTISHVAHAVPSDQKIDWLAGFLRRANGPSLVFVRTKRWADRLQKRLEARGIRGAALHADRTQSQRTAAVEGFRSGRYKVLVATDIAARGLDIEGIGQVINYEVPPTPDAYVHRVGRTGRAEATGTAITLVAPEEVRALRALEGSIALRLQRTIQ